MVEETVLSAARQHTILIAENDPDTMEILNEHFRQKGHKVIPALSVEATEAVLKYSRDDLDAAILDIRLTDDTDPSDESGLDLAEKTLSEQPEVDFPIFLHSRIGSGVSHVAPRPNLIEVPKSEGIAELSRSVNEEIKKKMERQNEQVVSGTMVEALPGSIWTKQHRALVALITLLLTLLCGLGAVVLGEPKLLLAAVVTAVVAVVVSFTLD